MYYPDAGQERRRSLNNLGVSESLRPRSASTGVIEVSPLTRGFSTNPRGPATPCFVSPRMAFSTQFNFDSPIQVLTSSSPGVFRPMAVPSLPGRCSLKRLPHRCKILLCIILLSFAGSLYLVRKLSDGSGSRDCNIDNTCDDPIHEHPSLKRFLGAVNKQPHYHSLTQDLENPNIEMPQFYDLGEDPSQVPQTFSYDLETNLKEITSADEEPPSVELLKPNPRHRIIVREVHNAFQTTREISGEAQSDDMSKEVDTENSYIISDYAPEENLDNGLMTLESVPLFHQPPVDVHLRGRDLPPRRMQSKDFEEVAEQSIEGRNYLSPQYVQPPPRRGPFSLYEREVDSRMAKHPRDSRRQDVDRMPFRERRKTPGGLVNDFDEGFVPKRNKDGLRMDRLPPGVNPRRYRTEF